VYFCIKLTGKKIVGQTSDQENFIVDVICKRLTAVCLSVQFLKFHHIPFIRLGLFDQSLQEECKRLTN
jgi:transcriptional antiterminator